MLQRRPNTFAQTILSLSFFACDKAADHTFLFAADPSLTRRTITDGYHRQLWADLTLVSPREP
jgi:hypothetical protein